MGSRPLWVRAFDWMTERRIGYTVPFTEQMIRGMGFRSLNKLGEKLDVVTLLIAEFGERDAQLIAGVGAIGIGCPVCSIGHTYAANVYHYRDHGELFPISETEVIGMQSRTYPELRALVADRLAEPRFERLRKLLTRQLELREGTGDPTPEDKWLVAANSVWDLLVEFTIECGAEVSHPFAEINRDKELVGRYRRARDEAEAAAPRAPSTGATGTN